ncbi:hypothetical protein ACQEVZ_01955 [Dactylosporangium sp. CA-152071]|uniref:hypothetical protein n=1 Tax=Dactylosporangium sp. CA-152071 TaxID=3239933 RepID=UPI003D8FF011
MRNTKSAGTISSWSTTSPEPSGYFYTVEDILNRDFAAVHKPAFEATASTVDDAATRTAAENKTWPMLIGKQREFYNKVVVALGSPTPLAEANKKVTETLRLMQTYTQLGFATALESDDLMHGLLFGKNILPGDYVHPQAPYGEQLADAHITQMFTRALSAYNQCNTPLGTPCGTNYVNPQSYNQSSSYVADCITSSTPGAPGDMMGNCLHYLASSAPRSSPLSTRCTRSGSPPAPTPRASPTSRPW